MVVSETFLRPSLGTMIRESTQGVSSAIPCSAWVILFLPSNAKGFVTTPTVRIPRSLAILAITGAAPVPVPPPIPAVTNTMSVSLRSAAISSLLSSAALWPIAGLAPAPLPLVSFSPMCIFCVAFERRSTGSSVLTAMNSTFLIPVVTILLTALPPPPPTPITLIFGVYSFSSSSSKAILLSSLTQSYLSQKSA